jgi:protein-disulfide isomerase
MENTRTPNPYVLPASILISALIIGGAIVYLVQSGGGSGAKEFPDNAFSQCVDSRAHAALIQEDYNEAVALGVNSTPTTFINGEMITVLNPETGEIGSAGANGEVIFPALDAAIENPIPAPESGPLALTSRDVVLGDSNAPVTLIEYGDYQCQFCGVYFQQVEPVLRSQYIDTGKVKMVFRNFQFLSPESVAAAEAAECAKDQDAFWEYHDALYTALARKTPFDREIFLEIAQDLELDEK